MFPRDLCPPSASSPCSPGDKGPQARSSAELYDRLASWCELTGTEFTPRNSLFRNQPERRDSSSAPDHFLGNLSYRFWWKNTLLVLHSVTVFSALQAMAVLVPRFPSGRHCQGWGYSQASLSLPSSLGTPAITQYTPSALWGCQSLCWDTTCSPVLFGPPTGQHPGLSLSPGRCPVPTAGAALLLAGAEMDPDCCPRESLQPSDFCEEPPSHEVSWQASLHLPCITVCHKPPGCLPIVQLPSTKESGISHPHCSINPRTRVILNTQHPD